MELLIIYMDFLDVCSHFFQGGNQCSPDILYPTREQLPPNLHVSNEVTYNRDSLSPSETTEVRRHIMYCNALLI